MNDTDLISLETIGGWIRIVQVERVVNGETWMGAYSISYNRHGEETRRTEPTYHTRVYWENPLALEPSKYGQLMAALCKRIFN